MMAAVAPEAIAQTTKAVNAVVDDPLAFIVKLLRSTGFALTIGGGVSALAGYYLKAEAVRAHQEAGQKWGSVVSAWGNIGAQFSNLQPLQNPLQNSNLPITTNNPLTDLENLGSDVKNGITGIATDISTGIQDLGKALIDIPPALVALGQALGTSLLAMPFLIWDEATYSVGGAIGGFLLNIFPYLLIFGAVLIVASFAVGFIRSLYRSTVRPAWNRSYSEWAARQEEKLKKGFDKVWHNPVPSPPKPPEGLGNSGTLPAGGGAVTSPVITPPADQPADPAPAPLEPPPAHPAPPDPPRVDPAPQTATEEAEELLGDPPAKILTDEEIATIESNREESMPVEHVEVERRISILSEGIAE